METYTLNTKTRLYGLKTCCFDTLALKMWVRPAEISVLSFINVILLILDLRTKVLTYDVIYDLFNKDYTI